jgi:hypothetical protein
MNFKSRILHTQKNYLTLCIMGNSSDVSQGIVVGMCRVLALCYETYEADILEKDQVLEALN